MEGQLSARQLVFSVSHRIENKVVMSTLLMFLEQKYTYETKLVQPFLSKVTKAHLILFNIGHLYLPQPGTIMNTSYNNFHF